MLFAAIFCSVSLWGQTVKNDYGTGNKPYKAKDNWFIGIHAGANHSLSENTRFGSFGDMNKPSAAFSVGKYFSPAIGARMQFAYLKQVSRAHSGAIETRPDVYGNGNYGFNVFGGYLDGLFNLNNIVARYDEDCRFNVVGILGVGFNSSFGFDDKVKVMGGRTLPLGIMQMKPIIVLLIRSIPTTRRFSPFVGAPVQLYLEQHVLTSISKRPLIWKRMN